MFKKNRLKSNVAIHRKRAGAHGTKKVGSNPLSTTIRHIQKVQVRLGKVRIDKLRLGCTCVVIN